MRGWCPNDLIKAKNVATVNQQLLCIEISLLDLQFSPGILKLNQWVKLDYDQD